MNRSTSPLALATFLLAVALTCTNARAAAPVRLARDLAPPVSLSLPAGGGGDATVESHPIVFVSVGALFVATRVVGTLLASVLVFGLNGWNASTIGLLVVAPVLDVLGLKLIANLCNIPSKWEHAVLGVLSGAVVAVASLLLTQYLGPVLFRHQSDAVELSPVILGCLASPLAVLAFTSADFADYGRATSSRDARPLARVAVDALPPTVGLASMAF